MARGVPPQTNPVLTRRDLVKDLSTSEKIGLGLQSFGAGVLGQEQPIDRLLRQPGWLET